VTIPDRLFGHTSSDVTAARYQGTDRIGALAGLSATPAVLARALAPLVAAFLAGATGGYTVPFLLLAGVAAAAAALGGRRL
jgi:hypothetical protein